MGEGGGICQGALENPMKKLCVLVLEAPPGRWDKQGNGLPCSWDEHSMTGCLLESRKAVAHACSSRAVVEVETVQWR